VVPALLGLGLVTISDSVHFVAIMDIVPQVRVVAHNMGTQLHFHHPRVFRELLCLAKMILISVFAVSHAIMATALRQPAWQFDHMERSNREILDLLKGPDTQPMANSVISWNIVDENVLFSAACKFPIQLGSLPGSEKRENKVVKVVRKAHYNIHCIYRTSDHEIYQNAAGSSRFNSCETQLRQPCNEGCYCTSLYKF